MNINFTLVMQAVAFAAFIWFTAKFVWPHLMRAIETRQKQIADGLAAGEQGRQSLATAEKRIADMLAEAKTRSSEIIAQGDKLKSETIEAAKAEAKAEADRILAAAKAEIEQEVAAREGSAARPGRRSRRRRRGEDPEARSRRQGARRPARVDPAAALTERPMAELTTIARPYAEAAFRIARDANALPVWSADAALRRARSSPIRAIGDGARQPEAHRGRQGSARCCRSCGDKLDPMGRNFVRVLVEADRIAVLPQIASCSRALKNDAEGVAKARIDSAFPLSDAQLAELKAALEKHFGKKIEATVNVDPALIGGARITVGDTVIDGTVTAQLAAMATQLAGLIRQLS